MKKILKGIILLLVLLVVSSLGLAWLSADDAHKMQDRAVANLQSFLSSKDDRVKVKQVSWDQGWWKDHLVITIDEEGKEVNALELVMDVEHGLFPLSALKRGIVKPMVAFADIKVSVNNFKETLSQKENMDITFGDYDFYTQVFFGQRAKTTLDLSSFDLQVPKNEVSAHINSLLMSLDLDFDESLQLVNGGTFDYHIDSFEIEGDNKLKMRIENVQNSSQVVLSKNYEVMSLSSAGETGLIDVLFQDHDKSVHLKLKDLASDAFIKALPMIDDFTPTEYHANVTGGDVEVDDYSFGPANMVLNMKGFDRRLFGLEYLMLSQQSPMMANLITLQLMQNSMSYNPVEIDMTALDLGAAPKQKILAKIKMNFDQLQKDDMSEYALESAFMRGMRVDGEVALGKKILEDLPKQPLFAFMTDVNNYLTNKNQTLFVQDEDQYSLKVRVEYPDTNKEAFYLNGQKMSKYEVQEKMDKEGEMMNFDSTH
ncbi:MAG: hypothetical protein KGV48_001965 [Alcaligenaceae bacterium]|nr:hypothetical protein [Alcaligenaceae bacterium]